MEFTEIIRGRFRLTACAAIRRRCVVCRQTTDKFPAQVMVLGVDDSEVGGLTHAVICPGCGRAVQRS